jgi:flagellar FliL protein
MDEGNKPDTAGERAAKKGSDGGGLNPGMIIAGIALLLVATMGSAFLAVMFLGKTVPVGGPKAEDAAKAGEGAGTEAARFGPTHEVGNFTVNLADPGERVFVKAGVSVELSNSEAGVELASRDPQVKDIVISVLSSRNMGDVSSYEGKEALKKELTEKINRLLTKGKVRSVFFTEFVFQ